MGDSVYQDLPCRYPQVRSTPLFDSNLDLPWQQIGSIRLGVGHARRTHTLNGSICAFHATLNVYPSVPTRANPIQTEGKYRPLCHLNEGGLPENCRTRISSGSLIVDIFVSDGAPSYVRVSFWRCGPLGFDSNRPSVLNLSTFGPPPVRRFRVTRHLRRISNDDALLEQEGLGQRLTLPELQEALDERGL